MARKRKAKAPADAADRRPPAEGGEETEEESVRGADPPTDSEDDIPDIVDGGSDDDDDVDASVRASKEAADGDGKVQNEEGKGKGKGKTSKNENGAKAEGATIPFLDAFYQLSSEDSPEDRAVAARDLVRHCFPPGGEVNRADAAYALKRLTNGLCTGRAASRQGFASCLSSFLRAASSTSSSEGGCDAMDEILKEEGDAETGKEGAEGDRHWAATVRSKLLSTTQFAADGGGGKGQKKQRSGGKAKGIEERDHAFGRLFGILAVVRSGMLGSKEFPSSVVGGYCEDLIDLYHYKKWMREPSVHALIELLTSLETESNLDSIEKLTNTVITPKLFLSAGKAAKNARSDGKKDRSQWMRELTPEQIAVVLHLQTFQNGKAKFAYPLDEPLLTAQTVPVLSEALCATSGAVHPRLHVVWDVLWMYLTKEAGNHRTLKANKGFPSIVEKIVEHVVVGMLLGKSEGSASPTNERRCLALQIVCALCGSSEHKIALPAKLIGVVLCPEVVKRVFMNVLCASGGAGKKKAKEGGVEHHLKPLTAAALDGMVDCCCKDDDADRRMAFVKAFLLADPRFDTKTKTQTVGSLLMLEASEDDESLREALWQKYLSFLEEKIVLATDLHDATVHIELMHMLAKRDLAGTPPANTARRVIRFFMSGAFFDCADLSVDSSTKKSTKKKKKGNTKATAPSAPQELSAGIRIQEILKKSGVPSLSYPARATLSARFYSLLSDFVSVINSHNRGGSNDKSFYGKGSKPESIYRALSEICGIFSLLETSGAKKYPSPSALIDADVKEASEKSVLRVQNIANDALVKECDGSSEEVDILRAKAAFATSCASMMMSLYLQLNSCTDPDASDGDDDDEDDVVESIHEYISDLADCIDGLRGLIDGEPLDEQSEKENPLAMMAGLLVNILSSPVGGENTGKANPTQASASKLTRETVKLAWSGTISVITGLISREKKSSKNLSLVDEDVMSILIESVCGEKSIANEEKDDDDDGSDSSEDEMGDSAFVDASKSGMDLDDISNGTPDDSEDSKDQNSHASSDDDDDDVELDPAKLENLLLQDSDAELDNSVVLEHHAGADKALAQLIKLKQESRKASQTERERIELCNRLRCVGLLDTLFSASVFKSGWLPIEAVLGSIDPILRSRKAIAKSLQAASSANAKKSLGEKNALLDRLSTLVKDKISKFRCDDPSAEKLALKASADICEEMLHSLNLAHCKCCSVALITSVRCISNVEESESVKDIYVGALNDWTTRKATKVHYCVFDDLIRRMPSLAAVILTEPLLTATSASASPFLRCESIKLLCAIYKHDNAEEQLSDKAKHTMENCYGKFSMSLRDALGDSGLQKAKYRDEVLVATKHFINHIKSHGEGLSLDSELSALQESLSIAGTNSKSAGMKQMCSQISDAISSTMQVNGNHKQKPRRSKGPKTSKTDKKQKKARK